MNSYKDKHKHNIYEDSIIGDIILFTFHEHDAQATTFFTGRVVDKEHDAVHVKYDEDESDEISTFYNEKENIEEDREYILRLLPMDIHGEALMLSALTGEYIHTMISLGFTGRAVDLELCLEAKTYVDGALEQPT